MKLDLMKEDSLEVFDNTFMYYHPELQLTLKYLTCVVQCGLLSLPDPATTCLTYVPPETSKQVDDLNP